MTDKYHGEICDEQCKRDAVDDCKPYTVECYQGQYDMCMHTCILNNEGYCQQNFYEAITDHSFII